MSSLAIWQVSSQAASKRTPRRKNVCVKFKLWYCCFNIKTNHYAFEQASREVPWFATLENRHVAAADVPCRRYLLIHDLDQISIRIWIKNEPDVDQISVRIWIKTQPGGGQDPSRICVRSESKPDSESDQTLAWDMARLGREIGYRLAEGRRQSRRCVGDVGARSYKNPAGESRLEARRLCFLYGTSAAQADEKSPEGGRRKRRKDFSRRVSIEFRANREPTAGQPEPYPKPWFDPIPSQIWIQI